MRRVRVRIVATLSPLVMFLLAPLPARAGLAYSACPTAGFSCASLQVPLDRGGRAAGTVSLGIERKLAGGAQSHVAVVPLAGGPGQAVLPLAPYLAEAISPALGTRDLLLFDQRGTGASGALSCPALTNQLEAAHAQSGGELIERCARQLGPARGAYTTRESVEDLEALRQAAGYEKLVLYGTSYGTKVALQYAERYPQRVESLVLDSTETPEGPDPFQLSTFKAIRPMLGELCALRACERLGVSPLRELARLVARLTVRPLSGHVPGASGRKVRVSIARGDLFSLLKAGDLNPAIRPQLPAAVHAALNGDAAPLSRLVGLLDLAPARESTSAIDFTLLLDTSCEETLFPWQRSAAGPTRVVEAEASLNALPSSAFYPFDPEAGLFAGTMPLCFFWPDASPAPQPVGALPNVPTLILSGGQDLRTPTEDARRVARLIPDAQLVRIPYTGHSVIGSDLSGCARASLVSFFAGAAVAPCPAAANRFPVAPLAPSRLSTLPPTRGVPGSGARTVTGVVDSLLDLRRAILTVGFDYGGVPYGARFGGLRAGTVSVGRAGVTLRRFSYIPGLELSGLVPTGIVLKNAGATATLRIGGSAAAAGRVRIGAGGRLSGTLAGHSFHVNAAAKVRLARATPGAQAPATRPPLPPLARLR